MAAILIKVCNPIIDPKPMSISRPKRSLVLWEISKIFKTKVAKTVIKAAEPTNPSSSAMTAKIESPIGSGKEFIFVVDWPKPTPVNFPEPMAMRA